MLYDHIYPTDRQRKAQACIAAFGHNDAQYHHTF